MKRRMRIRSALALILVFAMLFITAFTNIAASSEFGPPESFDAPDDFYDDQGEDIGSQGDSVENTDNQSNALEDTFGTEPQYYCFTGTVTYVDENNVSQEMPGILIRVYEGPERICEISTDAYGCFQAADLPAGNYSVQYVANGAFDPAQFTVPGSASGYSVTVPAEGENTEYFALIENVNISSSLNIDLTLTKKAEEEKTDGEQNQIPVSKIIEVTAEEVNLRTAPMITEDNIYAAVNQGAAFEVLEEIVQGDGVLWYKVSYEGSELYINSQFVQIKVSTNEGSSEEDPNGNPDENIGEDPNENFDGNQNEDPVENPGENTEETLIELTADEVNIRVAPSIESESIATLPAGARLVLLEEVTAEDGTLWYKVRYENGEVYVNGDSAVVVEMENDKTTEEVPVVTMNYEDDRIKIIVSAMEKGIIPEESTLKVIPIIENDSETAEQYAQVRQKLWEKAEGEGYDIAGFLAYDISFIDAEGNKTEPSGPVRVTMDYKQAAVPQTVDEETAAQADVTMMHLEEDSDGQVVQVVDMGQNQQLTTVETTEANEVQKTEFITNSFSAYTVTWTIASNYTVDLTAHFGYLDENGQYQEFDEIPDSPELPSLKVDKDNDNWTVLGTYKKTIPGYTYQKAYISKTDSYADEGKEAAYQLRLRKTGRNNTTAYYLQYMVSSNGESKNFVKLSNDEVQTAHVFYVYEKADALTTVETVDHTSVGITMRMIDYGSPANGISIGGSYGDGTIKKNLLEPVLNGNGYPSVMGGGSSLDSLFSGGTTANHLFRKDIYDATGYYEYSSFDNYAYLDTGSGNFTVYDQIGTPSDNNAYFYKRGNFMPYNQIEAGKFSANTNLYDQYGNALTEGSARYNEKLYKTQGSNNFYFGMYMGATFAQPKDGQAEHNGYKSPMRYEFNGDDDLWVYIDNVLVLDIGGIHDAHSGYIDFSTGVVGWTDCATGGTPAISTTTIKAMFQTAGKFPDGTAWDDSKVSEYFDGDTFKDYTTHTFKMFYMERGAGASNLYMRMNLPIIPEGAVEVTKELTNTDKENYANVKFAFQLYAQKILSASSTGQETYSETEYVTLNNATYKKTNEPVQFSTETFGETAYENVFFLKSDETVRFTGLKANRKYYVKEVGVNAREYDRIIINGVEYKSFTEDQIENAVIDSIQTPEDEVANRAFVVCQNNCSVYNSRELRITKAISETTTDRFTFKVWLENQSGVLEPYVGAYYLKDSSGNYYTYENNILINKGSTSVVCGTATSDGLIQNVPAGYIATVTQILSGTEFKVEEVLDTSKYQQYDKVVADGSCDEAGIDGADGTIALGKDAEVTITNHPYYKISVTKNWGNVASNPNETVYVGLYDQSGNPVEGKYLQLNSGNEFKASFDQLLSDNYSVKELKPVEAEGDFIIGAVGYSKVESGESISYADEEYTVSYGEMTSDSDNSANKNVTITNTLCDKAELHVEKIWSDMSDDGTNHESEQVFVGLYTVENNTEIPTDKTLVLNSSNEWKGTLSKLDKTKTYTIKELVETENGEFTIGEKKYSPAGNIYTTNGNDYKVTYVENPDNTDTKNVHSFQILNTRLTKLNIHKVNASGASLSGAEFKLQKDGSDVKKSDGTVYTVTTDTNGYAEFVDLEEGTYTIVETKAPAGYALPAASQTVTLAYSVTDPEDPTANVEESSRVERNGSTVYYEVTKTITNYMIYELPESGSRGIFWYLLGGVLLMMAAALIIYKNKCREVLRR